MAFVLPMRRLPVVGGAYIVSILFSSVFHKAILLMHICDSILWQVYIDCSVMHTIVDGFYRPDSSFAPAVLTYRPGLHK